MTASMGYAAGGVGPGMDLSLHDWALTIFI
jgi:hypothetical protein